MFDRLKLIDDLLDCRGRVIAPRGLVVSPQTIEEAAERAPHLPRRRLGTTALAPDLLLAFEADGCRSLFEREGAREAVERALGAVELPAALVEELEATRQAAPALHRHAMLTAAVSVRVLLTTAAGRARTLPDLAAAALLHDLGMRQLPHRLLASHDRLSLEQAHRIAAHPLLGAYHLAAVLGRHPAVAAARSHHWRCGQGYPGLSAPPARGVEVIAVVSAFCALTEPRPYRDGVYDARGAVDVLVRESRAGHADASALKLLVHALRGGAGDPARVRFGGWRDGHGPSLDGHTPVPAPARSHV